MAFNTTGDATLAQRTNTYAAAVMLRHALPVEILSKVGQSVPMPKNKGKVITWRRARTFAPITTPTVEGVTPTTTLFETDDITATLKQYTQVSRFTDQLADLHEDDIPDQISIAIGENIARSREALNWGVVRAGTAVTYANGIQRSDVNTPISIQKQRSVIRSLKGMKAQKFTSILSGSEEYGTSPIEASYIAVGHTNCEADIRNIPGFKETAIYGSRSLICPEEIGSVEDVRYLLSPDLDAFVDAGGAKGSMVSTSGTNADVYPIVYFGKDAWGSVALRGMTAMEVMSQMPGTPSDSDPAGQRGFVSSKFYHAAKVLNEAWMRRLEVAVSAL